MVSLLLLVCFVMLGSGAALFLHELDEQRTDERAVAAAKAAGLPAPVQTDHDDNNCPIHRQLHLPMIHVPSSLPVLVLLGLAIAFLSEVHAQLRSTRVVAVVDCRGPPSSGSSNCPRA